MRLRIRSINDAALLIALLVTAVVIVAGNIVSVIYDFFWWGVLTICVATFVVTWLFTRLVIKRGYLIETATQKMADEVERLEEMERFRRDYLGDFAHEIKTPVFNVQGYLSALADGALDDPAVNRMYLGRAERSVERIIDIVRNLDEISRLSSGAVSLDRTRFDVVELAREIVVGMEMAAAARKIRLAVDAGAFSAGASGASGARVSGASEAPGARAIWVSADRKLIAQVFINLISNSIRYGTEGGRTRISFLERGSRVVVSVADNGEGIAEDDLPRIFERFFRTDASRSRTDGGTGLGLAIVKHTVEAHGETVSVASELGVGSTFSFTLKKL